jgi:hypothetical protein
MPLFVYQIRDVILEFDIQNLRLVILTAVAPGTVGTVPTVPLFLVGTANRTTIWTE